MVKLTKDEIDRDTKMYTKQGEILYEKLTRYIRSDDELVRNTPLMSYAYASLMLLQDTYKTLIDVDPHGGIDYELENLRDNFSKIIENLKLHQKLKS